MDEHGVVPMPESYTVWFEYVRGSNPRLKKAIGKLIEENKEFDHDTMHELHNNYILREMNNKVVEEASSRVQQIMAGVLSTIETSSADTSDYNEELEKYTEELQEVGGEEVKDIVDKLVEKTNELKSKGEKLATKLLESQSEVEDLRENLEEVSMQVNLDALTGIANRKAFDEALRLMMTEAKDTKKDLCLLVVDVDHFKKFNDTYGHLLGDQVLRIVANAMRDMVRGKDFVARYGGEEFVILLPETPPHGAKIVAENGAQNHRHA